MNLQQVGLLFTSVTNSGFITGLYVIIVPLLGLFLGHKTGMGIWMGASLAVVGMFLLSVGDNFQVASGDWLQLAGAFVWGMHVLLVGFFASRHDAIRLAVIQFITCAVVSLILAAVLEEIRFDAILAGRAGAAVRRPACRGASALPCRWWPRSTPSPPMRRSSCRWKRCSPRSSRRCCSSARHWHSRATIGCALMFAGMLLAQLWPRKAKAAAH